MPGPHHRRRGYGFRRVSSLVAANASAGVCAASIFDIQDEESIRDLLRSHAGFRGKRQSSGNPPTANPPLPLPGPIQAPSPFGFITDFPASSTSTPASVTLTSSPPNISQNTTSSHASAVSTYTPSTTSAGPNASEMAIPTPTVSPLPAHHLFNFIPLPAKYGIPILAVAGVAILTALVWLIHTCVSRYRRRKFRRAEKMYRRDPMRRITLDGDGLVGGPRYVGVSGEGFGNSTSHFKEPFHEAEKGDFVSGYHQLDRVPLNDEEAFGWPSVADEEKNSLLYTRLQSDSGVHSHSRNQSSQLRPPQPSLLNPNRRTNPRPRSQSSRQPYPQPPTLLDRDNSWSNGTRSTVRIVQSRKGEEEDEDEYFRYASDSTSVALFALYQDDPQSQTRKSNGSRVGPRGYHSHRSQLPHKSKNRTNDHAHGDHPAYHRLAGGTKVEDQGIMPWERLRHKSIKRVILENAKKEKRWVDSLRGSALITGEDSRIVTENREGGADRGVGSARRKGVRSRQDDGPDGDVCPLGDNIPTTLQELEAWVGVSTIVGRNERVIKERGRRRRSYGRKESDALPQVPSGFKIIDRPGPATSTHNSASGFPSKARRAKRNGWIQVLQEGEDHLTNGEEELNLDKDEAKRSLFMASGIPTQSSRSRSSRVSSTAAPSHISRPPTAARQNSNKNPSDLRTSSNFRSRSRSRHTTRSVGMDESYNDCAWSSEGGFRIISESPLLTPLFSEPEHALESGLDTRPVDKQRKSLGASTHRSCSTPHNPAAPSEKSKNDGDKYTALPARVSRRKRSNTNDMSTCPSSTVDGEQDKVNERVTEQINRRRTQKSGIFVSTHQGQEQAEVTKTIDPLHGASHHGRSSRTSDKRSSRHHSALTSTPSPSKPKSAPPTSRPARSKIVSRDALPASPPQLMSPPLEEILFFTPRPDTHSPQPQMGTGGFWNGPGNMESLPTFASAFDVAQYDDPPPLPNLHLPTRAQETKARGKKAVGGGTGVGIRLPPDQPRKGADTKKADERKDRKRGVGDTRSKKLPTKTIQGPMVLRAGIATPAPARTKPSLATPKSYTSRIATNKTPSRPPLNPTTSSYYASSVSVYTSATAPAERA
ncbi:hypothetical protein BDN72DRAFT_106720 [Pluteus cervinus]|uniref:Uncharacterized protein n=1 Tax=Pluteus cervinus TaxID=181527 RepID=A0ACD3AMZ9_9AGAR|nr:hypothetical protein BDN72DRAFT_106720 [Pluteus cervinus]